MASEDSGLLAINEVSQKLVRSDIAIEKKENIDDLMHSEEWIFLQLCQVKGFRFDDLKLRLGITIDD